MSGEPEEEKHRETNRERVHKGREELERQVEGHRKKMDRYAKYYSENKGDIIEDFLGNFEGTKKPAIAGTIVLAPVFVTLFFIDWILEKLSSMPFIDLLNVTNFFLFNHLIKLAFIISFGAFLITTVGRLVRTEKGFRVEKTLDELMEKVPFLGSIYGITKVTADTVLNGAEEFSDPVKIEFNGARVTAYRTGNKTSDGREVLFVPTSPNITTGFVVEMKEEDIIETDDTPREALTRTLSAGFGDHGAGRPKRSPLEDRTKRGEDDQSR